MEQKSEQASSSVVVCIMYYAFGNHIYTFSSLPLMYSLFSRHISFSSYMPINFNIIHTFVSIHNTNAY